MPSWFQFRSPPQREDPAVAAVEQMLAAASQQSEAVPMQHGKAAAKHALAICACVTLDHAPKWLVYDVDDGGLKWRRVHDRIEPLDLVNARFTAGGHADPAEVLLWLQGDVSDPWGHGGDGWGNSKVLEPLRKRISPE